MCGVGSEEVIVEDRLTEPQIRHKALARRGPAISSNFCSATTLLFDDGAGERAAVRQEDRRDSGQVECNALQRIAPRQSSRLPQPWAWAFTRFADVS